MLIGAMNLSFKKEKTLCLKPFFQNQPASRLAIFPFSIEDAAPCIAIGPTDY
jgi:hypothetical protein